MAADVPERMVRISTGKVVTWTVEPHAIPGWIREPNIGFCQVGYTPEQPKVAVIELDKQDQPQTTATLMRIKADGSTEEAFKGDIQNWGPYFKYNYVKFDFSSVREPGVYYIQYGHTKTNNFLIDEHVYDKITDATTDVGAHPHEPHVRHRRLSYLAWRTFQRGLSAGTQERPLRLANLFQV